MEKIRIFPSKLQGTVHIPSSKSIGHREIICAGLARGTSVVDNISISKDMEATCRCLLALGAKIERAESAFAGRSALRITGNNVGRTHSGADCGESGSTLRFFIPVAALAAEPFTFSGSGKLVDRPLDAYYKIFDEQKIPYANNCGKLPLTISGKLRPGVFKLPGNVSSQFVSGLLFALPFLEKDSVIEVTSPLESASYVDLTLQCLAKYGVCARNEGHRCYYIGGGQSYRAQNSVVEGDWSQAAFWLVGGALGQQVTSSGVSAASLQGDRVIISILQKMRCQLTQSGDSFTAVGSAARATVIDAADCPDIIPVLAVLASVSSGVTRVINAGRLRLKECDRLAAITTELNKLGADVTELPEGLIINGRPEGLRGGCVVDAWNDHRIAMSLAIASQACRQPLELTGAASVQKSYPAFWQDFTAAGGKIEVLA